MALDDFNAGHVELGFGLYLTSDRRVGAVLDSLCLNGSGIATIESVSATTIEARVVLDECRWHVTSLTGELSMTVGIAEDSPFEYAATGAVTVRSEHEQFQLLDLAAGAMAPVYCWEARVVVVEGEITLRSHPDGLALCRTPIEG